MVYAKAVFGLFPANTIENEDDIEVYADEQRTKFKKHFLRLGNNQNGVKENRIWLFRFCSTQNNGLEDYIGAFCVTTGFGVEEKAAEFKEELDDYNNIMVKALADNLQKLLQNIYTSK